MCYFSSSDASNHINKTPRSHTHTPVEQCWTVISVVKLLRRYAHVQPALFYAQLLTYFVSTAVTSHMCTHAHTHTHTYIHTHTHIHELKNCTNWLQYFPSESNKNAKSFSYCVEHITTIHTHTHSLSVCVLTNASVYVCVCLYLSVCLSLSVSISFM